MAHQPLPADRLAEILALHKQWRVSGGSDGAYANLARANLAGADLAGADLAGADLAGANLARANLARAYLGGAYLGGADGIIQLGPIDGWVMCSVRWDDGPRIKAGCRWFTISEAREHWGAGCADRREHGDLMLAGVDALVSVAKAHRWPV